MTEGLTLPELAGAYMSLANNGTFSFARFIRKIESEDGETLYGICLEKYHDLSRVDEVCRLNGLEDVNKIKAGQKLILP